VTTMLGRIRVFVLVISLSSIFIDAVTTDPEYGCVMRGICGKDGDLRQNCMYSGPPVPINHSLINQYFELCPRLFKGGVFFGEK
jgi:hypothetical protein